MKFMIAFFSKSYRNLPEEWTTSTFKSGRESSLLIKGTIAYGTLQRFIVISIVNKLVNHKIYL